MIESESELLNFKETVGRGKQLVHSCCIRAGSQAAPQPEKENRPRRRGRHTNDGNDVAGRPVE